MGPKLGRWIVITVSCPFYIDEKTPKPLPAKLQHLLLYARSSHEGSHKPNPNPGVAKAGWPGRYNRAPSNLETSQHIPLDDPGSICLPGKDNEEQGNTWGWGQPEGQEHQHERLEGMTHRYSQVILPQCPPVSDPTLMQLAFSRIPSA